MVAMNRPRAPWDSDGRQWLTGKAIIEEHDIVAFASSFMSVMIFGEVESLSHIRSDDMRWWRVRWEK